MPTDRTLKFLIIGITFLSAGALFGAVMELDGALYASIAKNIVVKNDWLNLYVRGSDWLDKPHLPFWIIAISFKLLGISSFAYKLPSFAFGLVGAYYCYLFARELFNEKVALISALITLTPLHFLISTFDVRAEIYLMCFCIAAIYHFFNAKEICNWHLLAGSIFSACAVMTKGIFILVPLFAGFIIYWVLTKQIQQIFKPKWWIAILLIVIFISPELYSLYQQFDLHPEKLVFGQHNVSGIKFFFWDSQFGRFFNTGPIKGKGDSSFFLHTLVWAFLPWSVLLYAAVVNLFKKKNETPTAYILVWSTALVTFLIFSLSKFQLPHYIIIIFPQLAIITAVYLVNLKEKSIKIFFIIQNVIYITVSLLLILLALWYKVNFSAICVVVLVIILLVSFVVVNGKSVKTIIIRGVLTAAGLSIFLWLFFYPSLLNYQSGMQAANWLNQKYPALKPKVLLETDAFSFDLYTEAEVDYLWSYTQLKDINKQHGLIIYLSEIDLPTVQKNYKAKILKTFYYYRITKLKAKFINYKTREQTLKRFYLVKIN